MISSLVDKLPRFHKVPDLTLYDLPFEKDQEIFLTFTAFVPFGLSLGSKETLSPFSIFEFSSMFEIWTK